MFHDAAPSKTDKQSDGVGTIRNRPSEYDPEESRHRCISQADADYVRGPSRILHQYLQRIYIWRLLFVL